MNTNFSFVNLQEPVSLCCICERQLTDHHLCLKCDRRIHTSCGDVMSEENGHICNLCRRIANIGSERDNAHEGLQKQAEKILSVSHKILPPLDVGTNVVVKIPDVDRGRLAPRNFLTVVIAVPSSDLYQVASKDGVLNRLYARKEITPADFNFLKAENINIGAKLSLRTAMQKDSGLFIVIAKDIASTINAVANLKVLNVTRSVIKAAHVKTSNCYKFI